VRSYRQEEGGDEEVSLDLAAPGCVSPVEVVEQPAGDREERESRGADEDVVEATRAGLAQPEVVADERGLAMQVGWQLLEDALDVGPMTPVCQTLRLLPGVALRM
jgi:hypothetical protein